MRRSLLMAVLFVCVLPFCPGARADTILVSTVETTHYFGTSIIFAESFTGAPTVTAGDTFNFYGVTPTITGLLSYGEPLFRFSYTTPTTFTATVLQSRTLSLAYPGSRVQYALFNLSFLDLYPSPVGLADYTYTGSSDFVAGKVLLPLAPVAATPEPSSLILLLTGFCSLALLGWREPHLSVRS